jgi:lipoprotein-releasing system permease protein
VINGFETELRRRIVGFNTHVLVFARSPEAWAQMDSAVTRLEREPDILESAPFVRSEALAAYQIVPGRRTKLRGVMVKGIDLTQEIRVSSVIDSILPEITSFDTSAFGDDPPTIGCVLGLDLAIDLGVGLGEEIDVVTAPSTMRGGQVDPEQFRCRVLGFFNSGMYEFDSRFIYVDIKDAETMFDFETALRGVSLEIDDLYHAESVDQRIQGILSMKDYGTNNWINLNANLFSYMKIEKVLMFLMLTLIILVAAFNLVGMLTMVIMEKRREIGILRSIGASGRGVMSIFMLEGTAIGVMGTVGGLVTGLIACAVLDRIQLDLPGDVYFIKTLPVLVQWGDLAVISGISMVICFLATVYPSWEASRLYPVDAIRDM